MHKPVDRLNFNNIFYDPIGSYIFNSYLLTENYSFDKQLSYINLNNGQESNIISSEMFNSPE